MFTTELIKFAWFLWRKLNFVVGPNFGDIYLFTKEKVDYHSRNINSFLNLYFTFPLESKTLAY